MLVILLLVILPLIWIVWQAFSVKKYPLRKSGQVLVRPPAIPLIGHLYHMLPEYLIKSLKKLVDQYGTLLELYILQKRVVVVADVDLSREILSMRPKSFRRVRSMNNFAVPFNYHNTVFFAGGHEWS